MTKQKGKKKARRAGNFYTRSLQNQILIPFIVLLIFTGGIIALVSYNSSVNTTTDELTQNVETQMISMNDTFNLFFENTSSTLERFAANQLLVNYDTKNEKELLQLFKETEKANPNYINIYRGTESGELMIYPEADLGEGFNPKERDWYQDATAAEGEVIWTEPYIDESSGETVVTAAKAYYNGNKLIGVVGADVLVDTLIDMIDNVAIGETGYAVIIDDKGKYIAHPNDELIGNNEDDSAFYDELSNMGEHGIVEHRSDGEDTIIGFAKNQTTGWELGGIVQKEDFQKKARAIITPIAITLGVMLVLASAVSLLTARKITNSVRTVMERMNSIAGGDLSQEPLWTKSQDEIGQLVHATNGMNEHMRELFHQISSVSETVSSQSEEFTQSANEVQQGAEQVASTVQELAAGAENQAHHASDLSSNMQTFASEIDEANRAGENIQTASRDVLKITDEGTELMISSRKQMDKIDEIVQDAVGKVKGLDEQSQTISQLINVI